MKEQLIKKSKELLDIIHQQEMQVQSLEAELQQVRNNVIYYKGRYEQTLEIIKEIPATKPPRSTE